MEPNQYPPSERGKVAMSFANIFREMTPERWGYHTYTDTETGHLVLTMYASQKQLDYWDAHGVEICEHVRNRTEYGYCLGPKCRSCLFPKVVEENKDGK